MTPIRRGLWASFLASSLWVAVCPAQAGDTTAAAELARWRTQAGLTGQPTPAEVEQGRQVFTQPHGGEWSCASCHGNPPVAQGKHASTGKRIAPLAPAFNPTGFTDAAKVDKWFRRNCNDVFSRECTALEKSQVLAYLLSLR